MKKKLKSSLGDVVVPNKHPISEMANNFRITSYFQDQVCYIGQQEVFEQGSETIKRFIGVEISNKQIQRVSEYYGQCLEEKTKALIQENPLVTPPKNDPEPITYGMSDGSMLFTKEEGWKEIKIGRVFKADENIPVNENRNWIKESTYCAYLGGHKEFLERFDLLLKGVMHLVFIADGARWFWEWVSIYYPKAVQILDYFHCKEYLCEFAKLAFNNQEEKNKWIELQEKLLFEDKVGEVIKNIQACKPLTEEARNYQQKINTYYENNKTRMLYGSYRKKKFLIGSGPIESAHRNVLQKRLKLSGQRWSKKGLQQIANLRVVYHSNEWSKVVELIQHIKIAA